MTVYNVTNDVQLQAALAAQQDGDVINLSAGTFTTYVTVTADITINGAKAGQSGDSSSRGFGESVLVGGLQVNAEGTLVNGVQILAGGVGDGGVGAAEVNADNVTLANIYFLGSASSSDPDLADDQAVVVNAGVAGFVLEDNAFRGWAVGVSLGEFADGSIVDNLFDQNVNAIRTESVLPDVDDNQFQYSTFGDIVIYALGLADDASDFIGDANTFVRTDGEPSVTIVALTPGSVTTGTDFADDFVSSVGGVGLYEFAGGEGDDVAAGADGTDVLHGDAGADSLSGAGSFDFLYGDDGDDKLNGGSGDDLLDGGAGTNLLNGGLGEDGASYAESSGAVTVSLAIATAQATGAGTDTLVGIENLDGSAYADSLTGNSGANLLDGGDGADTVDGNAGNDILVGGDGDDLVNAGNGDDAAYGGSGDDLIEGKLGNDYLDGQIGRDLLSGGSGEDTLSGGENFDTLFGGADNDDLRGEGGNDTLLGGDGFDTLDGGEGSDTASFQDSAQGVSIVLASEIGAPGSGITDGGSCATETYISIENLLGSRFGDTLEGNSSANILSGDQGQDMLYGDGGADTLLGGQKSDSLSGGSGRDSLDGGRGHDYIFGGADDDVLTGGDKGDAFLFDLDHDDDTVTDFQAGSGKDFDILVYDLDVFSDFEDAFAHAIQLGTDVVIVEDNGDTVRLNNTILNTLTADNFVFADFVV
jgi:Ca2+-binding RTX toxin-like protein